MSVEEEHETQFMSKRQCNCGNELCINKTLGKKCNQVLKCVVTSIKKGRARLGKVTRRGFLEDVECEIWKNENNPSAESQPESGYGPTRAGTLPAILIVFSLYVQMPWQI